MSASSPPLKLTTLVLPHLPEGSHNVHIAVLKDVGNVEHLRSQLIAGNADYEYAFIDASTIISTRHILTAVFKALRGALGGPDDLKGGQMRTRNVHSEIVFSLSPNNNITESFARFGITATTKNLIAIKIEILPLKNTVPEHPQQILPNVEVVEGGVIEPINTPPPPPPPPTAATPTPITPTRILTPTTSLGHNQVHAFIGLNISYGEALPFTDEAIYSLADVSLVRERYKSTPGKGGKLGKDGGAAKRPGSAGGAGAGANGSRKKEKGERRARKVAEMVVEKAQETVPAVGAAVLEVPTPPPVVVESVKKAWGEGGEEVQRKVEAAVIGSIVLKTVA
ncbi:kinase binding protein CGI-121-domain-containing protein [Peziza echinospora]|nr:kinase binding protein CGI-121-domain-containing protein [Peziza echinospora]